MPEDMDAELLTRVAEETARRLERRRPGRMAGTTAADSTAPAPSAPPLNTLRRRCAQEPARAAAAAAGVPRNLRRPVRNRAHFTAGSIALGLALLPALAAGDAPRLDLRSLALGRICLGLLLVADLHERVRDACPFYSDSGCSPRSVVIAGGDPRYQAADVSLYFAAGTVWTVRLLFFVAAAAAACLTAGFYTRTACFGCWLHWRSIEVRSGISLVQHALL
jgi:hypothetical protein